jgi:hypothetical protein
MEYNYDLEDLLDHVDALLLLEAVTEELGGGLVVRSVDTGLVEGALEDELDGKTTRNTDELGHGRGAASARAVLLERGDNGLLLAVGADDLEGVLEEDKVDLSGLELALGLEEVGEGAEEGLLAGNLLVREEAERSELLEDDLLLALGDGGEGEDLGRDSRRVGLNAKAWR